MIGKKGAWTFDVFFILVLLVVLGFAFSAVHGRTSVSKKFGDLQKSILDAYHSGEKILFYVDYAAKNSIYQAAYKLGQKGGFYETECGDYLGYSLWQDCYPNKDILENNFKFYLNDYLNIYFLQYPDISVPLNNYDFLIDDNKIIGIALENVELDVYEEQELAAFSKYSIKPSFNQKIDFDISGGYETIVDKAKKLWSNCKLSENTEACVNNNKNIFSIDNLMLSDDCETELKKVFNNFAEEVYLCANSENNSCICKFNTVEGDYDSVHIEKNRIEMIKDDNILFRYDLDINYEGSSNFKPNKEIILLRRNNKLGMYDKEDLPLCSIKRKIFRFCVKSNKQIYVYSEEDKQTKLRSIQYKFALNFD